MQTVRPTTVTLAAGADVLAVLVFAAVGRNSHAAGAGAFGVLTTTAALPNCSLARLTKRPVRRAAWRRA